MDEKALALRLASHLEAFWGSDIGHDRERQAAAELRRLHAENERLHQINQSHEMKLSVRGYEIQIEDLKLAHAELRKMNGELLEALKRAHTWLQGSEPGRAQYLGEVIAKAEGEKP
jgi:hypothetical protein